MNLKEVTKEEFLSFVKNYKPNLSYGECKIGNFLTNNYIDYNEYNRTTFNTVVD